MPPEMSVIGILFSAFVSFAKTMGSPAFNSTDISFINGN
jgi:hypothetical protein